MEGERLCNLQTGKGCGRAQHHGKVSVRLRTHPRPPWDNQNVEQERKETQLTAVAPQIL